MPERTHKTLPVALIVIALTVFLAHFSLARGFGLYEDDYWAVAPHLAQRPAELWPLLVRCFTAWPQGRPLNHFLPPLLAAVGTQLGGLLGAYALAAAWLALNATLVFLVVRRLLSPTAALAAAVAYAVFPADSTKVFLVHAAHVQGAMTFFLLGAWLWLRGGPARVVSYPVAALTLLSYETAFLPFLPLPLLAGAAHRRSAAAWIRHALGCVVVVGVVGGLRLVQGESRVLDAAGRLGQMLWRSFSSLGLGPWTSGRMLLRSIPAGWRGADLQGVVSAALFAAAMGIALVVLAGKGSRAAEPSGITPLEAGGAGDDPPLSWTVVLVAGVITWSVSYALTLLNYPPTQTIGRLTSTHVAAGWGMALILASLVEGVHRRAPLSSLAVLVSVLSCWVLYQHGIQRQYVEAWSLEKKFWRQVLTLVPEAGPGWTVLVDGTPVEGPPAIFVNSWADVLAYRALVPSGEGPPIEFAHLGRVKEFLQFQRKGDRVEWRPEFWTGSTVAIDPEKLALLHDDSGTLSRVGSIDTPVGPLLLSAPIPAPGAGRPGPGPVGRLMFGP